MIDLARKIVSEAFEGKLDKAGEPYIFHLERVAQPFKEDQILYSIALLHDLLEDCPEWNFERLTKFFNSRICNAVLDLTKKEDENYADYLSRVSSNIDARKVKLSDLEDNMNLCRLKRKLTEKDLNRIQKYHDAYLILSCF